MIAPTFLLVLISYGTPVVVPELIYETDSCKVAGEMWKKSDYHRDYFCLPTPTVTSRYLLK